MLSIHLAFMLFESIFCFLAAFVSAANKSLRNKRVMVTLLNMGVGVMLLFEFLYYVYKDQDTLNSYCMVRISNFIVFFLVDCMMFLYTKYASIRLFGNFDLKKGEPCRIRFMLSSISALIGMAMVAISQFTGIYYYFDEHNTYHRGPLFIVSVIIPFVGMSFVLSVLIQYRKRISPHRLLVLASYVLLPLIGGIIQYFTPGYSYLEIMIGFAVILLFAEGSVDTSIEVDKAGKTEVRTGLANEHGCVEWLNSRPDKRDLLKYAAVFFDIIEFSKINKRYGMAKGDMFLMNYASKFRELLDEDEILGRPLGNQFLAIVKKEKLPLYLSLLEETDIFVSLGEVTYRETFESRAGIYKIDEENLKGEDIITFAGNALSIAKSHRTPHFVYMTRELRESIEEQKQLVADIQKGIEKGEFTAFYQPKVSIDTKMICGAEALARWDRNGRIISPSEFINIMETNDLICELDFYILGKVCNDIREWIDNGLKPPVISINMSRSNLKYDDPASRIDEVIEKYQIPRRLIEIEVTERADEFPTERLKNFVDSLHERGYRVSIDDFGCESSSLALLREINFDTLKIDKGFVDNEFSKDLTILEHIVNLAKAINVNIVAEGVERESQVEILSSMGVDVIQGFFYDEPIPKIEMTARIKNPEYK